MPSPFPTVISGSCSTGTTNNNTPAPLDSVHPMRTRLWVNQAHGRVRPEELPLGLQTVGSGRQKGRKRDAASQHRRHERAYRKDQPDARKESPLHYAIPPLFCLQPGELLAKQVCRSKKVACNISTLVVGRLPLYWWLMKITRHQRCGI